MKRARASILVATAAVGLAACRPALAPGTASGPDPQADQRAISATLDEYAAAWKVSDAQRVGRLYTDDAIILPGDHVAESGRAAIIKYNQDVFDAYVPKTFDISQQETQISGDLAFNRGTFSFSADAKDPKGKPVSDRGKYIVIMKRQVDGSWKWTRDIDNSDGPAAVPGEPAKAQ
jgi:uncharacterized protein (TIGR02246 family)